MKDQQFYELVDQALILYERERPEFYEQIEDTDLRERVAQRVADILGARQAGWLQEGDLRLSGHTAGRQDPKHATDAGSVDAPATSEIPRPERIGRYRINGVLGHGGMGVVYLAEQDKPRRAVALKVLRADSASESNRRRFELESQVLGRLHHPGIARIYEAGIAETDSGAQPFFAMEHIAGCPITEYAEANSLSIRARLELLAAICDAAQHAHQKGVIHRDLKPINILVDESGQPKILDFGVARAVDSDIQATTGQTDIGLLIGTLPYMSPEQVKGDPRFLDSRSDVYALGVVGYSLLAGQAPYDVRGKTIPEVVRIIRDQDPVPLSSINRLLRGDIESIISKALEKDVRRRYQSASEMRADIHRCLRNQPIEARPASALYQLKKFTQRNRGLVAGLGLGLIGLIAAVIGTSVGLVRASRSQALAKEAQQETETLLIESYVQAAKLAHQRGQWRMAIEYNDKALRAGYSDDIALRLGKVEAWIGLSETKSAVRELAELAQREDAGPYKGEILLYQGDTTLESWIQSGAASELVRDALKAGLTPADEAYAQGLLAERTSAALQHFRQAIALNPFHNRAHQMVAVSLLFLGRLDDARAQTEIWGGAYPSDPAAKLIKAYICALQHDTNCTETALAHLQQLMGAEQASAHRGLVEMIDCVSRPDVLLGGADTDLEQIVQRFQKLHQELSAGTDRGAAEDSISVVRVPACMVNSLGRLPAVFVAAVFSWDQAAAAMKEIVEANPEGTLQYIHGRILAKADRLNEAEEALRQATTNHAAFDIQMRALGDMMLVQYALSMDQSDADALNRATDTAGQLLSLASVSPRYLRLATSAAIDANKLDLAVQLMLKYQDLYPDDAEAMRLRMQVEYHRGAYGPAVRAADAVLARLPEDQGALEYKSKALSLLGKVGRPSDLVGQPRGHTPSQ